MSGSQCLGASQGTAYVHLGGKLIAEATVGGTTQYVHTDALGSPVAHTDTSGTLLNTTRYEPYGYVAQGTKPGPATSLIGFTGHVQDPETELVYMQQRYYDPIAGRFLSVDPIVTDANTGGMFGRYTYVDNSPYAKIDPHGMAGSNVVERVEARLETQCRQTRDVGGSCYQAEIRSDETVKRVVGQLVWSAIPGTGFYDCWQEGCGAGGWLLAGFSAIPGEGGLFAVLKVGKAAKETTTLYRAVTQAELKQIQKTGTFEAGANSLGGKWFAETADHARQWGNVMNGKGASTILEVQLPRSQADQLMRMERLDGIGPARYGELEQLRGAIIKALGL